MKIGNYLKYIFLIPVITILIFLRLHSIKEPLERDLTQYAYISHNMLDGKELYTYFWEDRPPGVHLSYMLAEIIGGYKQASIVWLGIIFTIVSLIFLYLFLELLVGPVSALIGAAFWALASNSVALQANQPNTEVFMNTFTIIGLWAFAKWPRWHSGNKKYLILSGIFFVLASIYKMIVVFPVFFICLYMLFPLPKSRFKKWIRIKVHHYSLFLLPQALFWILIFSYFHLTGGLSSFWDNVFAGNIYESSYMVKNLWKYFSSLNIIFHKCFEEIWPLVFFSILWLFTRHKRYGFLTRSFFYFYLLSICVEVASPGQFFEHYYQLFLPILCILSSLFCSDLIKLFSEHKLAYLRVIPIVILMGAFVFLGFYQIKYIYMTPFEISKKKYGHDFVQSYLVAQEVKALTRPCDKIFEWGAEPGIYYYSKRNSVTGFFFFYSLATGTEEGKRKRREKVFDDVTKAKPTLFIFNEGYGNVEDNFFFDFLQNNYNLVKKMFSYLIYKIKQPTECY